MNILYVFIVVFGALIVATMGIGIIILIKKLLTKNKQISYQIRKY